MRKEFSKHTETICCPNCNNIQKAEVTNGIPFATYIHECTNCAYMIMESEWKKCN